MSITKFEEQLAGYSLVERIGAGGYGEVWKAEAPGGLAKAVKFVYGYLGEERATRELKALQRVKEVRHPFLLSLERIEILDRQLVIVTELADTSLKERFQECLDAGLPGIPRKELLNHLRDTSEALDYMSEQFSLQHLDIKPENLLILGGRIKVADFGLVKEIENVTVSMMGGMTPIYAAPELFDGAPSRHSDQYSLAIVYQEMLTGILPFPGKTNTQLANQHLNSQPQLTPLPPADRAIIAKALAKDPKQRFPNCRAMIDSLFAADPLHHEHAVAPQSPKSHVQGHSTINITQVCDTKSPPGEAVVEIPSINISSSLNAILTESERPSNSMHEHDSAVLADAWLDIECEEAVRAMPPLNISAGGTLRPVLIIGTGGAAGRVLRKLHGRIRDRWENDLPSVGMLLVDADSQSLTSAPIQDAVDLPACSKMLVSLQRLERYHDSSTQLLRWLDRRWLYNLPRSGRPEGLRPLGRLAFIDHAEEIYMQIRATLEQILAPESLKITSQFTGLPIGSADPEIYIISSIGGGTGSGMIYDLAYGVRKVLAELGTKTAVVRGILTFSTPRHPDEKKLALANAHAALRELRYYMSHYPGEEMCGLDATTEAGGPFHEVFCVDWGDNLDDEQYDQAAERTADYLFANTLTPQRSFFEACRTADIDPKPGIKTFALCRQTCSRKDLPQVWVDYICRHVVDRWRGVIKAKPNLKSVHSAKGSNGSAASKQNSQQKAEAENLSSNALARFNFTDLSNQTCERLSEKLDVLNEAEFCDVLEQSCCETTLGEGESVHLTYGQIFRTIDLLVGPIRPLADWKSSPEHPLQKSLMEMLNATACDEGRRLLDNVLQTSGPLPGGCAAAQAEIDHYMAEIHKEDDQNRVQQDHIRELIARSEHLLSSQKAILSAPKKSWWRLKPSQQTPRTLAPCWLEYAQRRRELMLLQGKSFILQALKSHLRALNDKLRDLQHDLQRLAEHFPVEEIPTAEDLSKAGSKSDTKSNVGLKTGEPSAPVADSVDGSHFVIDQLSSKTAEITQLCADRCGKIAVMESDDALSMESEAFQLVDTAPSQLRHLVEEIVLTFLRPRMVQVWMQQAAAGQVKAWEDILASIKPVIDDSGGAARILISAPKPLLAPLREICITKTGIQPTLLSTTEDQIFICYELDRLSLPRVAVHFLKGQEDLTSLARRLQTRNDVAWSS